MKTTAAIAGCLLGFAHAFPITAGPSNSADYTITGMAGDVGGGRSTSTSYRVDAVVTLTGGVASAAGGSVVHVGGPIGQAPEVVALQVTAPGPALDEGATCQFGVSQTLDDATSVALAPSEVAWSVKSGPISSVSSDGIAAAATVYADTPAQVEGSYAGVKGTAELTVVDIDPDNFRSYAGDRLDDTWQVQYFGIDNPSAAPDVATDASGLTNRFKFDAGLVPLDSSSRLVVANAPVAGQPGTRSITISPTFSSRNYTVRTSTNLSSWNVLAGPIPGSSGSTTVVDPDAGPAKFYRVEVSKP